MPISPKVSDLTFEERPEYLHARISAQSLDRKSALDYLSEISLKCASTRCKQMLLERDVPIMPTDEDLFVSIKELVEMSAGIRIALVNPHVSVEDAMKHIDQCHHGADFKYFNDTTEAQRWLLGH
ncbi:MAG TPA: hypothetical protein VMS29_05880 [Pyrinomonadaceae bacterium]|nr:hypothetical protein [Pyrinomonadaceae bacterium]